MRVQERAVLERCIGDGLQYGYRRAHKHTDDPEEAVLIDTIDTAIWNEIHTYFTFEDAESAEG